MSMQGEPVATTTSMTFEEFVERVRAAFLASPAAAGGTTSKTLTEVAADVASEIPHTTIALFFATSICVIP